MTLLISIPAAYLLACVLAGCGGSDPPTPEEQCAALAAQAAAQGRMIIPCQPQGEAKK